jgi:hypothetical protein
VTILHPDGSTSQRHELPLALPAEVAARAPCLRVPGWLLTSPQGDRSWTADAAAVERLQADLAAAEEAALVAAAAAEVAAAAAAAAAAETPTRKGPKDRSKAISKQGGASSKRPELHSAAAAGADAASSAADAAAGDGSSSTAPPLDAAGVAAVRGALQQLQEAQPVCQGSIRAVQLTDPDTQAVVTTREDHLLLVSYTDASRLVQVRACCLHACTCTSAGHRLTGGRLRTERVRASARSPQPCVWSWHPRCRCTVHLQDTEGCRLSFTASGWLFEAAGMPEVRGNSTGITVQLSAGER